MRIVFESRWSQTMAFFACIMFVTPVAAWNPFVSGGRCKESRQGCRSTVGNAGGAGACCDPLSSKIFHCISNNPCIGGSRNKWAASDQPLKWTFHHNNRPDGFSSSSLSAFEISIKKAWAGWSKPLCTSFRSQYLGQGSQSGSRVDIQLPSKAIWSIMGVGTGGVLAFATPRADRAGNIFTGSVFFNPHMTWGVASVTSTQFDFTEVAHHEIGHIIGLAHTPYRTAVMYFQSQAQGPNFNGPQPDDVQGVCTLYPFTNTKTCTTDLDCGNCGKCQQGTCALQNGGLLCPCTQSAHCQQNLRCLNQRCQKNDGGEALDPCNDKAPCKRDFKCMRTRQGDICLQTCGKGAAFPPGIPGSTCEIDGSCPPGNECHLLGNGRTVCLKTCKVAADCSGGGQCLGVDLSGQRQNFCLCSEESKCGPGQTCNNFFLGGPIGVCTATTTPPPPCPSNFECKTLTNGHEACLPKPGTQRAGETCNATQSCRPGLVCAQINASTYKRVCIEDCSSSNVCSLRGICRPADYNIRQCYCFTSGDCGATRKCEHNEAGKGVCTGPPNICGNGECEPSIGENCASCAKDCTCGPGTVCDESKKICEKSGFCGNGKCEAEAKENCGICPQDCKCNAPLICENSQCTPAKSCGDGKCDPPSGEDCTSCPKDCLCPAKESCSFGLCLKTCGDGTCDSAKGEDCNSCAQDCACKDNTVCLNATCQARPAKEPTQDAGNADNDSLQCPQSQQKKECDSQGKCKIVCNTGCGCDSSSSQHSPFLILLLMCLLASSTLRRRRADT